MQTHGNRVTAHMHAHTRTHTHTQTQTHTESLRKAYPEGLVYLEACEQEVRDTRKKHAGAKDISCSPLFCLSLFDENHSA